MLVFDSVMPVLEQGLKGTVPIHKKPDIGEYLSYQLLTTAGRPLTNRNDNHNSSVLVTEMLKLDVEDTSNVFS